MTAQEKEQWEQIAQELSAHYTKEKDALRRAIDKVFRKAMTERVNLTLQECRNIKGKRILDVSCGRGSLAIQLAKRGATVVGLDSSQDAVNKANTVAKEENLGDQCVFIRDNFSRQVFDKKFDICIALGFFDYARDPEFSLKKMKALTKEKCIMSFSAKFAFQVPLRLIWLRSKNLPIYLYTKKELKRLFSRCFSRFKIKNISAGFYCVGSP